MKTCSSTLYVWCNKTTYAAHYYYIMWCQMLTLIQLNTGSVFYTNSQKTKNTWAYL